MYPIILKLSFHVHVPVPDSVQHRLLLTIVAMGFKKWHNKLDVEIDLKTEEQLL